MKDQHTKISGYRSLSQEEIDLMNRIKAKGAELLELQSELDARLKEDLKAKAAAVKASMHMRPECEELRRFENAEPLRWAAIGKTDIQTGIMALVRAVAQPTI